MKGSDRLERLIMAEGNDINEIVKVEDGEDCQGDKNDQPFVLLLRVTQGNGKQLPTGGFTGRAMVQMLHEIAGVVPKEVVVLTDQEVVMTLEEEASIWRCQGQCMGCTIGGQSITVDCLVARKDLVTEIARECEISREKQKMPEQEHHRMGEDQQDCQQQMMEILEKVSDQVKKVENIHRGSMPALEGEYYTPPLSQMRVNRPIKLSAPPNLPIFLGQEPVPSTEGSIDQWLFHVEGVLATPNRGSGQVSNDRVC